MPTTTTVITPTRFAQGLTYADFLAQATVNRDKFEMNYKDAPTTVRLTLHALAATDCPAGG